MFVLKKIISPFFMPVPACLFLAVLGLTTRDQMDTDGRTPGRGKEEHPADPDPPQLGKRARDVIGAFGKYLGQANARADMERFLDTPAGRWNDDDYGCLRNAWAAVKAADSVEEKRGALRAAMSQPESPGEQEPGEPPPPNDEDRP